MGFLSAFIVERKQEQTPWIWVTLGFLPVAGGLLGAAATLLEGWICVAMFAPIALICGSIGGLCGGLVAWWSKNPAFGCIAILPLLVSPWEHTVLGLSETRTVQTSIAIHSSPATVWNAIKSVPPIGPEELRPSWTSRIGFPRPLDATLSKEGVGGIRHARFARGVLFIETVEVWDPCKTLAFSIKAQTADIPSATLDAHVTVGGPYFDTLRGQYVIEPLSNGDVRLHLSSQHRLSTDFNWYARLWTDAVMADIQNSILQVLKQRCEKVD